MTTTTEKLAEALRLAKDYAEDEDWGRVKGCINLALAAHEAAARATAPETGDTNGRHDGLRPDLHGRVLLGGHTPGALADLLWASDDVMALNAELGLTMDQLVRLARAALAAAGHAQKPLTDERIGELLDEEADNLPEWFDGSPSDTFKLGIKCAERAHHITGGTNE